jgi:hypothetical protein
VDIVACPDPACQAPAWVYERWTWPSTDGPVGHARTGCESGHWFTPTAASLAPFRSPTPTTVRQAEAVR